MKKIITRFILIFLAIQVDGDENSIQCKDETGESVDWWVMYKLPVITGNKNPSIRGGVAYLYMTSKTVGDGWKLSTTNVTSENSIVAKTLSVLYNDDEAEKNAWILYNSHTPNKVCAEKKYGHANGVVIANSLGGLWMIHSVPRFPPFPRTGVRIKNWKVTADQLRQYNLRTNRSEPFGEYEYPHSGTKNGQSFLCISFNTSQINIISSQLIYNQVIPYKFHLPKNLEKDFPTFANITRKPEMKEPPYSMVELRSTEGELFISFAKTDKWQKDLYADLVAPRLQTNFLVETSLYGRTKKLPSHCIGSHVLNVKSIILDAAKVEFQNSKDHSKWAVAEKNETNKHWVCVGDINRVSTQSHRGGGAVCVNSPDLWKNFREAVSDVEACPHEIPESCRDWFSRKIWCQ